MNNIFVKKVKTKWIILFGALIGLINGFFGGGGGMVVVPVLSKLFGMEQKKAHATAIFVILPISIASSIIYITHNSINFATGWPVILGVIGGGGLGAVLLKKMDNMVIKLIFAILILFASVNLLLF